MVALAEHPDQRAGLAPTRAGSAAAVEECLRWVTPIQTFCRTVVADTTVGGHTVEAGDYLIMLYASGNRDERAFGPDGRPLRRHPPGQPRAPRVRVRRAPLPRRRARAPRGARLLRGAARAVTRTTTLAGEPERVAVDADRRDPLAARRAPGLTRTVADTVAELVDTRDATTTHRAAVRGPLLDLARGRRRVPHRAALLARAARRPARSTSACCSRTCPSYLFLLGGAALAGATVVGDQPDAPR